ncbi:MAG: energy transducer TonB [Bacteroidetes bacterium]|jgi:protein TonB|nr:energy transducer TonB [Bacteroidota bacterium]
MLRRLPILLAAVSVVLSADTIQDKSSAQDPPVVVKRVDPVYPKPIPKDSAEGTVFVQLKVDKKGDVFEATILKSQAGEALQKAALEAARQWKFGPSDKEMTRALVLPFKFKLSDEKKEVQEKK